jgi:hypothetical protein
MASFALMPQAVNQDLPASTIDAWAMKQPNPDVRRLKLANHAQSKACSFVS